MAWSQLATAVGSLAIGALGSFLLSELGDRWRSRRERQRHWEDRRVEAYAEFVRATKATMALLFRIAASLGNDPQPDPMPYDAVAKEALAEAFMRRDAAFEMVRLVGDPALVEVARDWVRAVIDMRLMVNAKTRDPATWQSLVERANKHRDAFHALARVDIGLITSSLSR